MRRTTRALRYLALLSCLVSVASICSASPQLDELGAPALTVEAGAVLPMFFVYEYPGARAAVSLAWPRSERTKLVASADTGVLLAPGSTRLLLGLGIGARLEPWRRVPVWGQLGLGATSYLERIGIVLPARTVHATDVGVALTADIALGLHVSRQWEVSLAYDQQLLWTGPNRSFNLDRDAVGSESLAFVGTAMVSIGRQL